MPVSVSALSRSLSHTGNQLVGRVRAGSEHVLLLLLLIVPVPVALSMVVLGKVDTVDGMDNEIAGG